jgi:methylmalonyl-CoA mutase N-terminal domain/subunit
VLGGTQSLHTNSFDEAIGLPTEESARIALRTQQILAEETGVANAVDPLAGSYLVEEMTARIVSQARAMIDDIDTKGGAMECIKSGLQQSMIHDSAWRNLQEIEGGEIVVVGVNTYTEGEGQEIDSQHLDEDVLGVRISALEEHRINRDSDAVASALERLDLVCSSTDNVMEPLIDAVKCGATLGEVNEVMRDKFGTWMSPSGV